ncbi:DPP IV N-terminal domain-containing protein [Mesobacillus subterraneus]|uniref:Dipeptidylpeptidase IV N-terminal domain-containing protein n=1 Tax=Mesobacillus subterraneus TaxID=285983 RepID=A0A3R9DW32_9BACI|nr:DPP IV N-terminal domain-containing protein [Mesobacillus subterraneus]RSD28716.1 hypothetical protein EJA10_03840 [Mesobacillus subterraneus]
MTQRKGLLSVIGIVTVLMAASIFYLLFADGDDYRYHTGLGHSLALSPNDKVIAFSFYQNGTEAIYTSALDGTEVKKVSNPDRENHRQPVFSADGSRLLYLSQNQDGIQSLYIANIDGANPEKLSKDAQHVSGAVFSEDGNTIFYASTPAKEFMKSEGESQEGFHLFSVEHDGNNLQRLTDQDLITIHSLIHLDETKEILFQDDQDVLAFDLEEKRIYQSGFSSKLPNDFFYLTYSPSRNMAAYTAVSNESKDSSLFKYELFLRDFTKDHTKRLTDLNTAVVSPVFFHQQENILFLENVNWPNVPEEYKLMNIDLKTKEMNEINLGITSSQSRNPVMKAINYTVNGWTVGLLYTLLLLLLTVYVKKVYLPSLISLAIALLSVAASFIVAAAIDPWAGIGVGMLAAGMLACTIVAFIFAFVWKFIRKGENKNV